MGLINRLQTRLGHACNLGKPCRSGHACNLSNTYDRANKNNEIIPLHTHLRIPQRLNRIRLCRLARWQITKQHPDTGTDQ